MRKVKSDFEELGEVYTDIPLRLRRLQRSVLCMSEAVRTLSQLNIPIPKKLSQALAQGRIDEKTLRGLVRFAFQGDWGVYGKYTARA